MRQSSLFIGLYALFLIFNALGELQAQPLNWGLRPVGQLSYPVELANIWGYVHPDGTEYALVGTHSGLSVVSLANPAQPREVQHIPGHPSIWREVRTWGNRAYFVTEDGWDGVTIVDLDSLPDAAPYRRVSLPDDLGYTVSKVHTIHIDDKGRMYLFGSNRNDGGALIFDLQADPLNPPFWGKTRALYAHDGYVRGDSLYSADIFEGIFTVHDLGGRGQVTALAARETPSRFTHNIWLSDNSRYAFTTDERQNAYVTAYDIQDLNNIRELDRWRDYEASGRDSVIPHNAHVLRDFVFVSYYTAGLIVLDGSKPDNLVEVARYDTHPFGFNRGFFGAWGVYPYLPSGLVLVSDMQTGLHVFEPQFSRAAWIEGEVRDALTGDKIWGAEIEVQGRMPIKASDFQGWYKQGVGAVGTYTLICRKPGYETQTRTLSVRPTGFYREDWDLQPLTTSVEALPNLAAWQAYPNPSSSEFVWENKEAAVLQEPLRVWDVAGREWFYEAKPQSGLSFGRDWPAGTYILSQGGQQQILQKR